MSPAQIIKTLTEIKRQRLLYSLDENHHKVAYFLVEEMMLEVPCTNIGSGDGRGFEEKFDTIKRVVNSKTLESEIYESTAYWQAGKKTYIHNLQKEIWDLIDDILHETRDLEKVKISITQSDGKLGVSNGKYLDGAVMYLLTLQDCIHNKLGKLGGNKRKASTLPQQMLMLDKIGILEIFYKQGWPLKHQAEVLSSLLNQDEANIQLYIRFNSDNYPDEAKGNTIKYLYKNTEIDNRISDLIDKNTTNTSR